jgi:putative hydrolase of the HAD superfamily
VGGAVREAAMRDHLEAWTPHTLTDPAAASVLAALRARGLRLGLLSNTHWPRAWHEGWLARDGVLDALDARVYTSDLPWIKPHPEAFGAVLGELGVTDPRSVVFVGDRPLDDIWGAKQLGMRAVHLPNAYVPPYDVTADATISGLGELVPLVDAWLADPT